MPSYELVATRDWSFDRAHQVGDRIPSDEGDWRVVRIEEASTIIYTGEESPGHTRLICEIKPRPSDHAEYFSARHP